MEITKEVEIVLKEAESMALQFQSYRVIDNDSLVLADGDLSKIKARIASLEEDRLKITRPLDASKKMIMDLFGKPIEALKATREGINKAMTDYRSEQERIRQEQERKLQELAKKEEEKQKKILAEKIARAEAGGKTEKVEELKAKVETVFVPAPVVPSTVVDTKNKPRSLWKYRIKDANAIPREYLIPDDVKIGQVVRATKGTLNIPGIEIYSEDSKF